MVRNPYFAGKCGAFVEKEVLCIFSNNNGILLMLILLLVFATTGAGGISGGESLLLILLALGLLIIGESGNLLGCGCRQTPLQ